MLPSHSLNGYQLGLNTLFIWPCGMQQHTHTHTNPILPTDGWIPWRVGSTCLKFGEGWTLSVYESRWAMNLKEATDFKRTNGLCDSFEVGKA